MSGPRNLNLFFFPFLNDLANSTLQQPVKNLKRLHFQVTLTVTLVIGTLQFIQEKRVQFKFKHLSWTLSLTKPIPVIPISPISIICYPYLIFHTAMQILRGDMVEEDFIRSITTNKSIDTLQSFALIYISNFHDTKKKTHSQTKH